MKTTSGTATRRVFSRTVYASFSIVGSWFGAQTSTRVLERMRLASVANLLMIQQREQYAFMGAEKSESLQLGEQKRLTRECIAMR